MEDNKPLGGKWNFDKENQKSISKLVELPKPRKKLKSDELTISTMVDVENCFPNSIGNLENFNWAVTHAEARKQLNNFLKYHSQLVSKNWFRRLRYQSFGSLILFQFLDHR